MIETHKSFCRFCHAVCGIEVDVDDGRPVAVRGDGDHAVAFPFRGRGNPR